MLCYANDNRRATAVWYVVGSVVAVVCKDHAKGALEQGLRVRRFRDK